MALGATHATQPVAAGAPAEPAQPGSGRPAPRPGVLSFLAFSLALAWETITYSRPRFLTALSALAFAILLMLAQLGFRNALLDSTLQVIDALRADVFVMNVLKRNFSQRMQIPRERVQQAMSVEGVVNAYPLHLDMLFYKNLEDGSQRPIRMLGFDPTTPTFTSVEVDAQRALLSKPGTALIDRKSRRYYGRLGPGPAQVENFGIDVVGTFDLGTDFEAEGNMLVSDETFFRIDANRTPAEVEMVLVQAAPGTDPSQLARAIAERLPSDVQALSKEEFLEKEHTHWKTNTPIGLVFALGLAMGFLVGVVICYQILYTDVMDHLKEYATLKAMGYSDRYIVGVVLSEAVLLSLIALVPSLIAGTCLYALIAKLTGLLLRLTWARAGTVAMLTTGMCMLAGFFAVRKVLKADPADLF